MIYKGKKKSLQSIVMSLAVVTLTASYAQTTAKESVKLPSAIVVKGVAQNP